MVFESVAAGIINDLLGNYVDTVDSSQLELGLWKGHISLGNLDIKQGAIDDLDLPFRVAYGHIEKLTLKIPWWSPYCDFYSVDVEGIYIILVPKSGVKYNAIKEQKLRRETKQRELARLELCKQRGAQSDKPLEEKQDIFMRLKAQIFKNVKIRIRNVHIRYEDSFTVPSRPFSVGVTLQHLTFHPTNDLWDPHVLDASARIMRKYVEISKFGLYWEPDSELFLNWGPTRIKSMLHQKISNEAVRRFDVSYLLVPFSCQAMLTTDTKPEIDNYSTTGTVLNVRVDEISTNISKRQFQDMLALSESITRAAIGSRYRKYRPNVPVHKRAKLWWWFAGKAVLEEQVRQRRRNWSLKNMHEHVLKVRAYKAQYKVKLQTKQSTRQLKILEDSLDVFNIMLARRQVELEIEDQLPNTPNQSWLSSWWFSWQSSTATQTQDTGRQFEKVMTPAEKEKLYAAISYQDNSTVPTCPVTFVSKKLSFLLRSFSLAVHDEEREKTVILGAMLDNMSVRFEERPRTEAIKVESEIGKFSVFGFPEEYSKYCRLIVPQNVQNEKCGSLEFLFEANPVGDRPDRRLHLLAEAVEMIYDAAVISALVEVFRPPEQVLLDKLMGQVVLMQSDIKAMLPAGLQWAIEQRKTIDVLVNLKPSYLVMYEGGHENHKKLCLVISFGQLCVHGLPRSCEAPTPRELVDSGSTEEYDKYTVRMTAEVVVCPPGDARKNALRSANSELHVLQATDLLVDIDKYIIANTARLPKVRVTGKLPWMHVSVTDIKLVQVLKVLNSIPMVVASSAALAGNETPVIVAEEAGNPINIQMNTSQQSSVIRESARRKDAHIIDLEMTFDLTEVVLDISQVVHGALNPMVLFQAHQLCLKTEMRPLDVVYRLCTKKIVLHMDFQAPNSPGPLKILYTTAHDETKSALSLLYLQTIKKQPEFEYLRGSVLEKVSLDISGLRLILHDESICALVSLFVHLRGQLGRLGEERKVAGAVRQATMADPMGSGSTSLSVAGISKSTAVVSLDVNASLNGLQIEICSKNRSVCHIGVPDLEAGMVWYPMKRVARLSAKTIQICDFTPGAVHKDIVVIPGDKAIDFEFTTYKQCGSLGCVEADCVDFDIKGTLGRLYFTFLYKCYLDIMHFVDRLQAAKQMMYEATTNAAQASLASALTTRKQAYKMAADIRFKGLILYLPENCKSRNVFMLDFGSLCVHNAFELDGCSTPELPCLMEKMVIEIDGLQISRLNRIPYAEDSGALDSLLLTTSLTLRTIRNMNLETHPEVPEMSILGVLPKIEFTGSKEDCCAVMRTLEENMDEILSKDEHVDLSTTRGPVATRAPCLTQEDKYSHEPTDPGLGTEEAVKKAVRFDLLFLTDCIVLDFYLKRTRKLKEGLARIEIKLLCLGGHMLRDGSYEVNTTLGNLILDDTRVTRTGGLTRVLTKSSGSSNELVNVLYKVENNGDCLAKIDLSKIIFVYCVDFFDTLITFYLDTMHKNVVEKMQQQRATKRQQQTSDTGAYPERNYTVQLEMDKLDIVLVADIADSHSSTVVLKGSGHLKMRQVGTTQTASVVMDDVKMFTCCICKYQSEPFHSELLKPTKVSLHSAFTEENGQHMEINFSPIQIHMTPTVLGILFKVLGSLRAPSAETTNQDRWHTVDLNKAKLWFLEEQNVGTTQEVQASRKDEQALITAKTFAITLEIPSEKHSDSTLLWKASLEAEVLDWSSKMSARGSLGSVVYLYDEKLAAWEPLVEPVEVPAGYKLWEITLKVNKHTVDLGEDNTVHRPPMYSIEVLVEDTLEVSITPTTLQVLKDFSGAFSAALVKTPVQHERSNAPYIVKNYLGETVRIILEGTPFRVAFPKFDDDIGERILEPDAMVQLTLKETSDHRGRILGTLDELCQPNLAEKGFAIEIQRDDVSAARTVCLTYADKRGFKIPMATCPCDHLAFIVDTTYHNGSKVAMLYSVCKIVNYLSTPIEVFYMGYDTDVSKVILCGVGYPHKVLHLPISALCTKTNELFFKPAGENFRMSRNPFIWKPCGPELSQTSVLECPATRHNPARPARHTCFYISASRKTEHVTLDKSKTSTMPLYCIVLRPMVLVWNLLFCRLYIELESIGKLFCLESGQRVELCNAKIGESTLQLKLLGYCDMDWSGAMLLEFSTNGRSRLTLRSKKGNQMDLGIHVEMTDGCVVLGLYWPFCMVNKTTKDVYYKTEDSAETLHSASFEGPVPLTLSTKEKVAVKIFDSKWSEPFSVKKVGSSDTVVVKSEDGYTYLLSVGITLAAMGFTRIVTFTPYYLVLNNCKHVIEIHEHTKKSYWERIVPGGCRAFWPEEVQSPKLVARYANTAACTVPFSCKENKSVLLQWANKRRSSLYMSCKVTKSAALVTFSDYEKRMAPVFLVNHSSIPLKYCQCGYQYYELAPRAAVHYTWDDPSGNQCLFWGPDDSVRLSRFRQSVSIKLLEDNRGVLPLDGGRILFWIAFPDGRRRTVLFTEDHGLVCRIQKSGLLERNIYDVVLNIQAIGISLVAAQPRREVVYISVLGSGVRWESKKECKTSYKAVSAKEASQLELQYQRYNKLCQVHRDPASVFMVAGYQVDFKQMQILKNPKKDLRRFASPGIWAAFKKSQNQIFIHTKLHKLQVDNQIADCTFPVVVTSSTNRSQDDRMIPKPLFETSVIIQQFEDSQSRLFKFGEVLVEEFHARVDESFMNAMGCFFEFNKEEAIDFMELMEKDKSFTGGGLKTFAEWFSQQDLFGKVYVSPIKLHLSISISSVSNGTGLSNVLLQSLAQIQDAVFSPDSFENSGTIYLTTHQLISEVRTHYIGQAITQIYVFALGLDVFGNPVGLLKGCLTGAKDFFYKPFQGAIEGPDEFAEGMTSGVRSLIRHTIGGAAGSASRITGTLGKSIAALSMDEDYQKQRRLDRNRRPDDIAEGIAQGGKDLFMGVYEGVTGVVTKPVAGAKKAGVSGFFKGVGKGFLGAVTRSTAGVADFVRCFFDAVQRATDVMDEVRPVRPARFIRPDGIIRPYNLMEAQGNKLLQDVDKGKYAETDMYVSHLILGEEGRAILLVTDRRLMYVLKEDVCGRWKTKWAYSWDRVKGPPTLTSEGIRFFFKKPVRKVLLGYTEIGKVIVIKDPEVAKFIAFKIKSSMRKFL